MVKLGEEMKKMTTFSNGHTNHKFLDRSQHLIQPHRFKSKSYHHLHLWSFRGIGSSDHCKPDIIGLQVVNACIAEGDKE